MFAEALIFTEAIYDVRESDIFPRTFETDFINLTVGWRDMLILLGGKHSKILVQAFNYTSGEWQKYPDLPDDRQFHGCIALPGNEGKILVAGGLSVESTPTTSTASNRQNLAGQYTTVSCSD